MDNGEIKKAFPLTHNFPADLAILTLNKQKRNPTKLLKLNKIKGRSQPYSIIVSSLNMLKQYANIDDFTEIELKKMGHKTLTVELQQEINEIPTSLKKYNLSIGNNNISLDILDLTFILPEFSNLILFFLE